MNKGILFLSIGLLADAQTPQAEIRKVLDKQVVDWNRGDVDSFMQGYHASPDTAFVGKSLTKGYASVLANYKVRYPTKAAMGTLRFEILETRLLGPDHASVIGRFYLTRTAAGGGDAQGIFNLIFMKTREGWKVILDHTSS